MLAKTFIERSAELKYYCLAQISAEKFQQMQFVWLCIFSSEQFRDKFENTPWKKTEECKECD